MIPTTVSEVIPFYHGLVIQEVLRSRYVAVIVVLVMALLTLKVLRRRSVTESAAVNNDRS